MAELAEFVRHGVGKVTPRMVRGIYQKMPMLKVAFAEIEAPGFPHLGRQLDLLASLIEDFSEGKADDVPYSAAAGAAFAILYMRRELDLIPDTVPEVGMADDSGVVRVVLMEHERVLSNYADRIGVGWRNVTTAP